MANNNCKYYKEEEYQSLDGGTTWTAMGVYRKGDLLQYDSPDCGTPTPTFDGKFKATYNDSTTYSAACDGDTTLTTGNTKPSGYDYSAMTTAQIGSCVTSIGYGAFEHCSGLTSIIIPNSVTSIGMATFQYCPGLTSVTIPDSVTSIGTNAFSDCSSLTSVDIPDSVTSIGNGVFQNCYVLTSIDIPSGITSIGNGAFYNCSSLTSITVNATTPPTLGNNAFYNTNNCPIIVPCQSLEAYKTSWSDYADRIQCVEPFDGKFRATYTGGTTYSAACDGNTTLTSGNTRQSGYDYYAMQTVEIGDCVTSIGGSAFYKCSKLTSITIPSGVTSIGSGSFQDCSKLTSITIPSGVTSLGDSAFRYCYSLTSITIPNTVSSIGDFAFNNCRSLTSCTIGSGVTSIGMYAFQACSGLTSIDIPNSVTRIGSYSFNRCTNLTSCTIGSGVTNILSGAFYLCNSLTNLIIYATTPPALVGSEVFYGTPIESGTGYIYVPAESVNTYKSASGWSTYANQIRPIT